jgi:hypothetical protein
MQKLKSALRELEEVLMELFKVLSFSMAVSVVLLVEAWGISKVWAIVIGR